MFKSPISRKPKSFDGRRASDGILKSIDSILGPHSGHSIKSVEEIDDDALEEEFNSPTAPTAELAKRLQPIPMASPGVFMKRKSMGTRKSRRARAMKDGQQMMGGSLSAIESMLSRTGKDGEQQQQSPAPPPPPDSPLTATPSSAKRKKKRKSSKKRIQALKESRGALPPFQSHSDDEEELEGAVKDAIPRRASMGTLSEVTESSSRRGKRALSNSLHSGMKSSMRRDRSSGVETSSRRSRRTLDADGSSRRSRRTLDTADGSSRRSRRTLSADGNSKRSNRKLDVDGSSSARRSKRSVMTEDDNNGSSRRSRRALSSEGSVRSLKSKSKKNKKKDSKKSKRKSAESYASNSTSVTADMDESWNSLINSQRDVTEEDDTTTEREDSFKHPLAEEAEEKIYEVPLAGEEDDAAAAARQGLASPLYNDINNSLHKYKHTRSNSSTSSLDLDDDIEEEEEDDEAVEKVQEKKKELPKFLAQASLGSLGFELALSSDDDDSVLVPDELPSITEEAARPTSRRSLTRASGGSTTRRGLSCGPTRSFTRGREPERQSSKRGFSVSPERQINAEVMDMERPLLSCMKGSRGKLLSVKLKDPKVYFNECLVITPIIPTYELATKKSDLWFRQKDFDKILNRSMAIALRIKEGKKTRKCVRGLEHFLKDKEERYAAWNAVLVEQEIQNLSGNHSDEKISDLYLAASTTCRTEAQERAQEDYDAIVRYILED